MSEVSAGFVGRTLPWRSFLVDVDGQCRQQLVIAAALVFVSAVLTALSPIAFKFLVDGLASGTVQFMGAAGLLAAYVGSEWLARALAALRGLYYSRAEQRLQRRLSRRALDHVLGLPMQFHLDRKLGALTHALAEGLAGHKIILHHVVHTALPVAVELLIIAVVIAVLGAPALVVMLLAMSVAYVAAFFRGATRIAEPARAVSTAHAESYGVLADSLLSYEAIKCFGAEHFVREKYDTALAHRESCWLTYHRLTTADAIVIASILAVSLGTTVAYAGAAVARGTMTVGDFVLVNAYVLRVATPLEALGVALRDVIQGFAFLRRLLAIFEESQEPRGRGGSRRPQGQGALTFEAVHLTYCPGIAALREISFSVGGGQTGALVGPTGSGKSSLARLLLRLYEPTSGRIFLDGVPIADVAIDEWRRSVAVVPQDTVMFNDTIAANIALGLSGSSRRDIEWAAQAAHLHTFVTGLPRGYDTVVGERGLKLSGGERQRLAIARALLRRPRLFVLDEATSMLDLRTEREVLARIAEIARGTTLLVIAHRLSAIAHADQIVVLNRGSIAERGTHDRLMREHGVYAAMWHAQEKQPPTARARRDDRLAGSEL